MWLAAQDGTKIDRIGFGVRLDGRQPDPAQLGIRYELWDGGGQLNGYQREGEPFGTENNFIRGVRFQLHGAQKDRYVIVGGVWLDDGSQIPFRENVAVVVGVGGDKVPYTDRYIVAISVMVVSKGDYEQSQSYTAEQQRLAAAKETEEAAKRYDDDPLFFTKNGILIGATIGSYVGPEGTLVGACVGGAIGLAIDGYRAARGNAEGAMRAVLAARDRTFSTDAFSKAAGSYRDAVTKALNVPNLPDDARRLIPKVDARTPGTVAEELKKLNPFR